VAGKVADMLNDVICANQTLGVELARVSRVVGKEGKLSQRVELQGSGRVWAESIESVNSLIEALVRPTSEMQRVIGAVAGGDLSKKVTADVHGEVLELKNTINGMVDCAPVRRDGAGPVDQPRARAAARRRDRPQQQAERGQHVHRLSPTGSRGSS
jgi:hypothetical protein